MVVMITTEKKLEALVARKIHELLEDDQIKRRIAMEYLVSLKKTDLNKFLEAVELRRQSDEKLARIDKSDPDIDKAQQDVEQFIEQ